jgi:hypothetical protein
MRVAIALGVFVLGTAGAYITSANSHIDIFPCEIAERKQLGGLDFRMERIEVRKGTCSLLYHQRGERDGEYHRFTEAGWAAFIAFCTGIGAAAGGLAYALGPRRK